MKNIVIVESPAKGKTIEKYLGPDYQVLASFGHVRDLPKSKIGVDVRHDFEPQYEIPQKAKKVVSTLKKAIAEADVLYLATDYDREGEAIAWHLISAIKPKKKAKRITFHEITKPAIIAAIKSPREIDLNLVDAQQARRVLDRLVGYKLSPFLWQKVAQGLSAGRVQSVAVRLIVDREKEIQKFVSQEYWSLEALLGKNGQNFKAVLVEKEGKKLDKFAVKDEKEAKKIEQDLTGADYVVSDLKRQERKRMPPPPFTTSTLQQDAGSRLGFSSKQTMKLAQDLYEKGLITYMRTDSVQVSVLALNAAKKAIEEKYGKEYALEKPRFYRSMSKNAQEAHEAIRPTSFSVLPQKISISDKHSRLYGLIFFRMLASQMQEAIFDELNLKVKAGDFTFGATGVKVKFPGFLVIGKNHQENILPDLKIREKLDLEKLEKIQHFTEPPARYSEGALVKELEKRGIGRPSTYAPVISTIQDRRYVEKKEGRFFPTDIGTSVSDLLVKHFPEIVDYNFTAKMEEDLDKIAEGRLKWQPVVADFYEPFSKNLSSKIKDVPKNQIEEKTTEKCPDCGKGLVIKLGRYGKFMACSGFPECKFTKPVVGKDGDKQSNTTQPKIKEKCPKCGSDMILKESSFGPFLACSGFPKCKTTKNIEIAAKVACPNCGGKLVRKNTKKRKFFWGCANFPKCKTAFWDEPTTKKCPNCGSIMLKSKSGKIKCSQCK